MIARVEPFLVAAFLATSAISGERDAGSSEPSDHAHAVDRRGDQAMGFSHEKTAHHFALTKTGGVILASVTNPADEQSRASIIGHFRHIASAFKKGDFEMPMFIHDRIPPGVPTMKRLGSEIDYAVEETPAGARIVISTNNPVALAAIHEFLRFQIADHRTGDSTTVQR